MRISDWSSDVCSSDLLARNLYEFGVGRTTRLVAEVLRKAEERGEIRVSDANFAAEQFISSVILSPFRRAALGVGVTSYNETSSARMRQAVDLFVYGCRPSQKDRKSTRLNSSH